MVSFVTLPQCSHIRTLPFSEIKKSSLPQFGHEHAGFLSHRIGAKETNLNGISTSQKLEVTSHKIILVALNRLSQQRF
ncbi:hypothetical protein VIBNIAM115_130012 [Vibrio nigripulchritudo AM115]|nr:hypothetical protein VIBNIAM115_130012 [Vibrio nigripulchritudo AM115]